MKLHQEHRLYSFIIFPIFSTFSSKLCDQFLFKKKLKIKSRRPDDTPEEINQILHDVAVKYKAYEKKDIDEMIKTLYRTDLIQCPSEYILFGINSITRHLEKAGDLELLMVRGRSDHLSYIHAFSFKKTISTVYNEIC